MSEIINPEPPTVRADGTGTTYHLGDGLIVRVLNDGRVRVRAANHTVALDWLTNKQLAGDNSIVSLRLTRKDIEQED
jgi:hypothetical protein